MALCLPDLSSLRLSDAPRVQEAPTGVAQRGCDYPNGATHEATLYVRDYSALARRPPFKVKVYVALDEEQLGQVAKLRGIHVFETSESPESLVPPAYRFGFDVLKDDKTTMSVVAVPLSAESPACDGSMTTLVRVAMKAMHAAFGPLPREIQYVGGATALDLRNGPPDTELKHLRWPTTDVTHLKKWFEAWYHSAFEAEAAGFDMAPTWNDIRMKIAIFANTKAEQVKAAMAVDQIDTLADALRSIVGRISFKGDLVEIYNRSIAAGRREDSLVVFERNLRGELDRVTQGALTWQRLVIVDVLEDHEVDGNDDSDDCTPVPATLVEDDGGAAWDQRGRGRGRRGGGRGGGRGRARGRSAAGGDAACQALVRSPSL